jgi:hypothetical protein
LSGLAGWRCLNLFSGLCGTTEVVPFPLSLTGEDDEFLLIPSQRECIVHAQRIQSTLDLSVDF